MRKWLVVLLVISAACADKDPTGPETVDITGTYTLETINNQPMPYVLVQFLSIYILAQLGGTMTLNADRTYIERADLREAMYDSVGNVVTHDTTVVLRGQWEREDSAIVLLPNDRSQILFGLAARGTLTLSFESLNDSLTTYFYRRNTNGSGSASRPHLTYPSPSPSVTLSGSTTRLLTTVSSITGRRSTTTSSPASTRASAGRASTSRALSTTAAGSSE